MSQAVVEGRDLKAWFHATLPREIGVLPVSTSPKPVHVLHGILQQVTRGPRQTRLISDLVAPRYGNWKVAQDEIRARHSKTLDLPPTEAGLDQLRHALSAVLTSDGAFFADSYATSQLAHPGLVGTDQTHNKIGTLAAAFVTQDPQNAELMRTSIRNMNDAQPNPHWGLQRTLIDDSVSRDWLLEVEPIDPPRWANLEATQELWEECSHWMGRTLQVLAGCDSLIGLQTLAVTATWIGLLSYAQVPSLTLYARKAPLLLECTAPGESQRLRNSSAEHLLRVHNAYEEWLTLRLAETIREDFGVPPTDGQAKHYLETMGSYKLAGGRIPAKLEDLFASYCIDPADGSADRHHALANSVRDVLIMQMGNMNREWFHSVGRHCGFVGPRRGQMPRLRCEVSLLPSIVLAGLPDEPQESIRYDHWLDNLATRFGLHVGPGPWTRITHPHPDEHSLVRNQNELARLLEEIGLARRFSDGVTEVLDPRLLWSLS